jgi:hypothetical protein
MGTMRIKGLERILNTEKDRALATSQLWETDIASFDGNGKKGRRESVAVKLEKSIQETRNRYVF